MLSSNGPIIIDILSEDSDDDPHNESKQRDGTRSSSSSTSSTCSNRPSNKNCVVNDGCCGSSSNAINNNKLQHSFTDESKVSMTYDEGKIKQFIEITGGVASKAIAIRHLEMYDQDLNRSISAYFADADNDGSKNNSGTNNDGLLYSHHNSMNRSRENCNESKSKDKTKPSNAITLSKHR